MCSDNPTFTPAMAQQIADGVCQLQNQEIADRVRQIFASRAWAERRRRNQGISDLDLLEQIVQYGQLWAAVIGVEDSSDAR
jgi:hypothetical protein